MKHRHAGEEVETARRKRTFIHIYNIHDLKKARTTEESGLCKECGVVVVWKIDTTRMVCRDCFYKMLTPEELQACRDHRDTIPTQ